MRWAKDAAGEWEEKVTYPKIAPAWLAHKDRRTYDGVEFFPARGPEQGTPKYFNLWRGFSVHPTPEILALSPKERRLKYAVFYDHLTTNICSGDPAVFKWVWHWFAHILQRPRERVGTALVLRGKMGVGKTVAGDVVLVIRRACWRRARAFWRTAA